MTSTKPRGLQRQFREVRNTDLPRFLNPVARIDCSEAAAGVRKLEVVLTNGDRYPFELSSLKVKTVERMGTALGLGATTG